MPRKFSTEDPDFYVYENDSHVSASKKPAETPMPFNLKSPVQSRMDERLIKYQANKQNTFEQESSQPEKAKSKQESPLKILKEKIKNAKIYLLDLLESDSDINATKDLLNKLGLSEDIFYSFLSTIPGFELLQNPKTKVATGFKLVNRQQAIDFLKEGKQPPAEEEQLQIELAKSIGKDLVKQFPGKVSFRKELPVPKRKDTNLIISKLITLGYLKKYKNPNAKWGILYEISKEQPVEQ